MSIKKILAMLLAVAMLFAFVACGDDKDDKDEKDDSKDKTSTSAKEENGEEEEEEKEVKLTAAALEGKWKASATIIQMIENTGDDDDMPEELYDIIKKLKTKMTFYITFDDEDATITVDGKDAMQEYVDKSIDYMVDGGAAEMSGMSQEEFLEQLESAGMTLKEYRSMLESQMDVDMLLEDMEEEIEYKVEGNKIYFDNEENYLKVKFNGTSFKVLDVEAEEDEDGEADLPIKPFKNLTFKKTK